LIDLMGKPMAVISPSATLIPTMWDYLSQNQRKIVSQALRQFGGTFEEIGKGVKVLRLTIPQLI